MICKSKIFFKLISLIGLCLMLTSCPSDENPVKPNDSNFKLGNITNYQINSTGNFELSDSVSGGVFVFPEGGKGNLGIARILSSDNVLLPETGTGFYVEYSGSENFFIAFPRTLTSEPTLSIYAKPLFSTYEIMNSDATWISIKPNDTTNNPALFEMYYPGNPAQLVKLPYTKDDQLLNSDRKYFLFYKNELKVNASWKRIEVLRDLSKQMIVDLLGTLPDNIKPSVQSEINGRLKLQAFRPGIINSGYIPWWYLKIVNPLVHPYIMYRTVMGEDYATESTAAHEIGHYFSHAILGDNLYGTLTDQSQRVHDLGLVQSGRNMIEEWAHYSDYCLNIKIGRTGINKSGYDIEEMNTLFKNKQSEKFNKLPKTFTPQNLDWPSLEGFSAGLLARLHASKKTIENHFDGDEEDIPTIELTHKQIYEILCKKAMNTDELLKEISNYLKTSDEKSKLTVIMERCGWSYNTKCLIKLSDGTLVKKGKATPFIKIGNKEYTLPSADIIDGSCVLTRIFPSEKCSLHLEVDYSGCVEKSTIDFVLDLNNFKTSLPTNKSLDDNVINIDVKPKIVPLTGINQWLGFYYDPSGCNNCWGVRNNEKIPFSLGGRVNLNIVGNSVTIGPVGRDLLSYEAFSGGGTVEVNKFFNDCTTDPKYLWNLNLTYKHDYGSNPQPPTEFVLEAVIKSEAHKKTRIIGSIKYKQFKYDSFGSKSTVCECSISIDKEISIP